MAAMLGEVVCQEGKSESTSCKPGSSEDEEEEEVESKLKYERLSYDLPKILRKDAASSICIHPKFLVLGSHWGVITVLDHLGNKVKELQAHTTTVNQISIDEHGDYIASCSDDGRIIIHGLYSTNYNHQQNFDRPIKAIAVDPNFYKSNSGRRFITGDEKLILHERSFLSRLKATVLYEGDGPIRNIKWKGQFVAWAIDVGVRVYDIQDRIVITLIKRDHNPSLRPELYRCNLFWKDNTTLLVGWADTVKICIVKSTPSDDQTKKDVPSFYVEIAYWFTTDFYVCGIAPFEENLVILSYSKESDVEQNKNVAHRPQLCVIEPHQGDYFEVCTDVLSIRGYQEYRCNDYHLDCLPEEGLFFIVSPKDVVVAKPRDADDHIMWLMDHARFEEAMAAVTQNGGKEVKRHSLLQVGQAYLDHLLATGKYTEAASLCVKILGKDKNLWEEEVFKFAHFNQLKAIAPYLPKKDLQLDPAIYEMVLNEFLQSDYQGFHQYLQNWNSSLYNVPTVIAAVWDKLTYEPNCAILLRCLGDLYTYELKYNKAFEIYLDLGLHDVFDLIYKHHLFKAVCDHLEKLIALDKDKTIKLCLENIDKVPVDIVVKRLENHPDILFHYLDRLFAKDPHQGRSYHGLQVKLYAEHGSHKLLSFLKSSNDYPLQEALEVCRRCGLTVEQVFLLGRMGNLKQALQLITQELNDVHRAIEFCKEHNDKELWDDLIRFSLDKPTFINVLLQNIGTHVNPIIFIEQIKNDMEIPGLRDSLVKILQDYNLQISLREGCKKILVADCFSLQERLNKQQKKGISIYEDQVCPSCHKKITVKDIRQANNLVVFYCKHVFHEDCLPTFRMETCSICSTQKRRLDKTSQFLHHN